MRFDLAILCVKAIVALYPFCENMEMVRKVGSQFIVRMQNRDMQVGQVAILLFLS